MRSTFLFIVICISKLSAKQVLHFGIVSWTFVLAYFFGIAYLTISVDPGEYSEHYSHLDHPPDQVFRPSEKQVGRTESSQLVLDRVISRRLSAYESCLDDLASNLKLQVVFVILSLFLIYTGDATAKRSVQIPVLGLEVPLSWSVNLLPAVLLWLWLQYGYLLNFGIDHRFALWRAIELREGYQSESIYSISSVLGQAGFLDGWFHVFTDDYFRVSVGQRVFMHLLIVLYGVFFGLAHACVFSLIRTGETRSRTGSWMYTAYMGLACLIYFGSHYSFYTYGHKNWLQIIIAATACLGFGIGSMIKRELPRHISVPTARVPPIDT